MSLVIAAAHAAWNLGNLPAAARFQRALHRPAATQQAILLRYLREDAATAYGRRHGFARIRSVAEFQQQVPLSTYDDYRPYIQRIAAGEARVLTHPPVSHFAVSSGSAGAEKWIPYTPALRAEFGRAIAPWIANLHHAFPALARGPAYWSITPAADRPRTATRIPVGFDEDSAYLGGFFKRLVDCTLAVPGELRHVGDMPAFRYLTLLCLLRARSLRLVSVWHPSFFSLLLAAAASEWDRLLADIRTGTCRPPADAPPPALQAVSRRASPDPRRAAELAALGPHAWSEFWPDLQLLSCWSDAHARCAAADLAARFPRAILQGKGLLSTEAFISFPLIVGSDVRYPLAIRSHFLELLPDAGPPIPVEAAETGGQYAVVVTTGGGFYRYLTHDRVRITGRHLQTPCVEFLGKTDLISDLFGEKLNAHFVGETLAQLPLATPPPFTMLAPDGPGYTLYVESAASSPPLPQGLSAALDALLARNPHYAYCRRLGQLAPPRIFIVHHDASPAYLEACRRQGRRLGDIKPTPLHTGSGWSDIFVGHYA